MSGSGTLPGANGGLATVSVEMNRFLFWTFGYVTVNDPGAGIDNLTAPIFFAPVPRDNGNGVSVSSSWFNFGANGFKSYTINATFRDGGANN